jgi:MtN3 and saliva related transmembrane protein
VIRSLAATAALTAAVVTRSSIVIAVLGYVAAVFTTSSAIPQLVHTLRTREVAGVSIPSWATLSTGAALWLTYGIFIGSGPLIAANAVSLALDLAVLSAALRYRLMKIQP